MQNKNIAISLGPVIALVVVFVLVSSIGMWLSFVISDAILHNALGYQVAYKTSSESDFEYAKNTKVGTILAEGMFTCDKPVSDPRIDGVFASIRVDIDYYTMHTTTTVDSKGMTHIKTYYSWDWFATEYNRAETFSFLGQTGPVVALDDAYESEETVYDGSVRYRISTIPTEFYGVGFWSTSDDFHMTNVWREESIDQVVDSETRSASMIPVVFMISWTCLSLFSLVLFICCKRELFIKSYNK